MVKRINNEVQDIDSTIPGNHEWKGAAPNLISKLTKTNIWQTIEFGSKVAPKRNKIDAKVCVKKYLIADSLDLLL